MRDVNVEGREDHVNIWRMIPSRGGSKCKGPGAGMGFAGSRNSKNVSVSGDSRVPSRGGKSHHMRIWFTVPTEVLPTREKMHLSFP